MLSRPEIDISDANVKAILEIFQGTTHGTDSLILAAPTAKTDLDQRITEGAFMKGAKWVGALFVGHVDRPIYQGIVYLEPKPRVSTGGSATFEIAESDRQRLHKIYRLAWEYQTAKTKDWNSHYDPQRIRYHKYLISALIGRQVNHILEASSKEEFESRVKRLEDFIERITEDKARNAYIAKDGEVNRMAKTLMQVKVELMQLGDTQKNERANAERVARKARQQAADLKQFNELLGGQLERVILPFGNGLVGMPNQSTDAHAMVAVQSHKEWRAFCEVFFINHNQNLQQYLDEKHNFPTRDPANKTKLTEAQKEYFANCTDADYIYNKLVESGLPSEQIHDEYLRDLAELLAARNQLLQAQYYHEVLNHLLSTGGVISFAIDEDVVLMIQETSSSLRRFDQAYKTYIANFASHCNKSASGDIATLQSQLIGAKINKVNADNAALLARTNDLQSEVLQLDVKQLQGDIDRYLQVIRARSAPLAHRRMETSAANTSPDTAGSASTQVEPALPQDVVTTTTAPTTAAKTTTANDKPADAATAATVSTTTVKTTTSDAKATDAAASTTASTAKVATTASDAKPSETAIANTGGAASSNQSAKVQTELASVDSFRHLQQVIWRAMNDIIDPENAANNSSNKRFGLFKSRQPAHTAQLDKAQLKLLLALAWYKIRCDHNHRVISADERGDLDLSQLTTAALQEILQDKSIALKPSKTKSGPKLGKFESAIKQMRALLDESDGDELVAELKAIIQAHPDFAAYQAKASACRQQAVATQPEARHIRALG